MHTSPRHQKQKLPQTRTSMFARVGSRLRGRKRLLGLTIFAGLGVSTGAVAAAHEAQQATQSPLESSLISPQQSAAPSEQSDEGVSTGNESSSNVTEVKTDVTSSDTEANVQSTVMVDGQPVTTSDPSHQNIVVEGSNSSVSVDISVDSSSSTNSHSSSSTDISVSSTNNQGNQAQAIRGSPRR
ncbi:TPA: hypothetical protein DCF80_03970 [Candidatus Saccharibacteria bacterium]|nr:hypothetical protein [Candidatus Saccharibacteria bacterium]HRK41318.1 hypothetical protein [Candidatus Saccharibacteria bacterium]